MTEPLRRPLLRRREVAALLGLALRTVDKLPLHRIEIRTVPGQLRPAVRFDPDEVDAYIAAIKKAAAA